MLGSMPGTIVAWGQIIRSGTRQGELTVIPRLPLLDVTGSGAVTFQPERQYVFNQAAGATVRKRHSVYAPWTQELADAITDNHLNPSEPVQANDTMVIPGVGSYTVDDADAYPGHHIKIYTTTPLQNA